MLEHIVTELRYLLSYLQSVETVRLLGVLHSNKKDLIASNDKADTQAPGAIIKSGLINQMRVWRVVMTGEVTNERQDSWSAVEWWTLGAQTGRGVRRRLTFYLWRPGKRWFYWEGVAEGRRASLCDGINSLWICPPPLYIKVFVSYHYKIILNFSQLNCQSFSILEHYTFKFLIDLQVM